MTAAKPKRAKVSAKGWVVIPAPLRKKYGIEPGTTVEIKDANGKIVLLPNVQNPVEEAYGMLADGGLSLTEELLAERAKDLEREEAKIRAG